MTTLAARPKSRHAMTGRPDLDDRAGERVAGGLSGGQRPARGDGVRAHQQRDDRPQRGDVVDEAEPRPPQPRLVGPPRRDPPAAARRQAARGQLRRRVRQLRPSALSVDLPDPGDAEAAPARPPDRVGDRLPPLDRPRRPGIVTVDYRIGDVRHRREVFVSQPDDVVVVRLESSAAEPAPGRDEPLPQAGRRRHATSTSRPCRWPAGAAAAAPASSRCSASSPSDGTVEAVGDHLVVRDRGATHDRRRRGDRLPPRRLRGRGAADDRRGRRPWLRRDPRRPRARAQRQDAPVSISLGDASPTRPTSSPRLPTGRAARSGSGPEATTPACSPCSSSSAATCCSARADRGRCRPTSRGSGTRCTSRRGTASSRSTSTPR